MEILAPLSGVIVPLGSVPDAVFAQKLLGDGVAVDPISEEVLAPVAGTITQLHKASHALAVTSKEGVEVLIHIGLDTVFLEGRGFTPLVAVGDHVTAGQPLLRFDAEAVARAARSLLTEIVVTSTDRVARLRPAQGLVEAGKSTILVLDIREPARAEGAVAGTRVVSDPIVLQNAAGLHARPAAILAHRARSFAADVRVRHGGTSADAKSVLAIMGLDSRPGDELRIEATGPGAAEAVAALSRLIAEGSGEKPGEAPVVAPAAPPRPTVAGELPGAAASPGLAIGTVVRFRRSEPTVIEAGRSAREERASLGAAVREARRELEALRQDVSDRTRREILGVQVELLDDPELDALIEPLLAAGKSAAFAWREAYTERAAALERLESPLLRERASDVRDVGRRVLGLLAGGPAAPPDLPDSAVVIAEELTPSEVSSFERGKLAALCTTTGSATSHVAILARNLGVPAICGVDEAALALADGTVVVVDGDRGVMIVSPDDRALGRARERITRLAAVREEERSAAGAAARTRDGHRVEVAANISNLEDARAAVGGGAEGVGLLRTELLFHGRETAPSEADQAEMYAAIAAVLGSERRFVVRTLDVGGDKPLSYVPLPKEANPFLGVRGIRVSLEHPELFRTQLRAIARAAGAGNVYVMFPMISSLEELRAAKTMLAEELRREGLPHPAGVGAMIEVPSAAVIAEVIAREVDFLSIGTNDLTQYTLAMDRGHPKLARRADALHPAVLRLIETTVAGAHHHARWVGVCGGIASDPLAVPILVGLGVDELSVSVPAIASVKAALSRWTLEECRGVAAEALSLGTAEEIRALLAARQASTPARRQLRPVAAEG